MNRSTHFPIVLLPVFVIITLACSFIPFVKPAVTPAPGAPETTPVSPGQPPSESTPAAPGQTPLQPTPPAPDSPGKPVDLANARLPQASLLLNAALSYQPQMMVDQQGILHVILYDGKQIIAIQRSSDGNWSEKQVLAPKVEMTIWDTILVRSADGSACVLWPEGPSSDRLLERCYVKGQWNDSSVSTGNDQIRAGYVAAYAPDGSLQIISEVLTGDRGWKTSTGRWVVKQGAGTTILEKNVHFDIDQSGGYHFIWEVTAAGKATLNYIYSKDQGQTWTAPMVVGEFISSSLEDILADQHGGVHLVWEASGSQLYYRHWSTAKGWGDTQTILGKSNMVAAVIRSVDLAVDDHDKAYVVIGFGLYAQMDAGKPVEWSGVAYHKQNDNGQWSGPVPVAQYGQAQHQSQEPPVMTVDKQGRLLFVWQADNLDINFAQVP